MLKSLSQTVYGHVFPETEDVVRDLWSKQTEFLLAQYQEPWIKKQDGLHEPMLQAWKRWSSPAVNGLNAFDYAYPTAGASEGIREMLAVQALQKRPLIVFEGEYEGYEKIAAHYGIETHKINREDWQAAMSKYPQNASIWLSQPSAIDGNVWGDYDVFLRTLSVARPDVNVWLDLSYVGAVAEIQKKIEVDHPCVEGVVVSWSKPFGVYYHRVGALWSRKEQMGLWGNKWFKNLFALKLGEELCTRFPIGSLAQVARTHQFATIERIQSETGLVLVPSDVALLATLQKDKAPEEWVRAFNRAPGLHFLRVCLTPAFKRLGR